MADSFRMVETVIDPDALKHALVDIAAGAAVCFEGWVRNHHGGEAVVALEYEAHAGIAEDEGAKILAEARQRFEILSAHGCHRTGRLEIGDCAVWAPRIAVRRSMHAVISSTSSKRACRSGRKSITATDRVDG